MLYYSKIVYYFFCEFHLFKYFLFVGWESFLIFCSYLSFWKNHKFPFGRHLSENIPIGVVFHLSNIWAFGLNARFLLFRVSCPFCGMLWRFLPTSLNINRIYEFISLLGTLRIDDGGGSCFVWLCGNEDGLYMLVVFNIHNTILWPQNGRGSNIFCLFTLFPL